MRRKVLCLALALVLLGSFLLASFAFEDSEQHWASESIDRAVALGLFNGVSDTEFQPDAPMTRAMFVTVLGRLAGIDPDEWACDYLSFLFSDVDPDAYYAPYLSWAVHVGVASGTGEGRFSPGSKITREQMARFITNYLDVSGSSVAAPAPELPVDEPEEGQLPDETEPAEIETDALPIPSLEPEEEPVEDEPVSYERLLANADQRESVELTGARGRLAQSTVSDEAEADPCEACEAFSDASEISDWARSSVGRLVTRELLNGMPDGEGGTRFAPQNNATRAECATLFCRLIDRLEPAEDAGEEPVSITINEFSLLLETGQTRSLEAVVFPVDTANDHVLWYSTDASVASVDANGSVTAKSEGFVFIYAVTCNCLFTMCEVQVTPATLDLPPAAGLGSADMTNDEKDMLLFGRLVDDPRTVYLSGTKEQALEDMLTIQVQVWDLHSDGTKYTRTFNLTVHRNIAPTVQAIFAEIYALPEQPVIHSLGGFRWDGKCEHTCGTAIDINPYENPYVSSSGNVLVGDHFNPDTDPYSIPIGGSIDRIFAKYGFTRGIYWNSGTKDYMHYSFYGM